MSAIQPIPSNRLKPLDEQGYFVRDWYIAFTRSIGGSQTTADQALADAIVAQAAANAAQATANQATLDAAAALAAAVAAQADVDALEQVAYVLGAADPTVPNALVLTGDTGLSIDLSTPNVIQLLLNVVTALGYTPFDQAGGTIGGSIAVTGTVKTQGYTVATLPAGVGGMRAFVIDALAPTFLAPVVGGGAAVAPVFYDGGTWVTA